MDSFNTSFKADLEAQRNKLLPLPSTHIVDIQYRWSTIPVPVIERWPSAPGTIPSDWLGKVASVLISLTPILFLVLAGFAYKMDGMPVSKFGEQVMKAAQIGTTVYPIIFAAVLGKTFKSAAGWLVERGTTIHMLELLMGSQSLGGALQSHFTIIRTIKTIPLSLFILLIWLLSPLGGQASLRLLSTSGIEVDGAIRYLDTYWQSSRIQWQTFPIYVYDSVYQAMLVTPTESQQSSMDIWGNVKIPKLESLNQSTSDIDGWVQVPKNQNLSYVSLIGVPMAGTELIRQTFSKFTIQYTYFHWDCTKPDNRTILDPWFAEIGIDVNKALNSKTQPYRTSMFARMPTVRRKLGLTYLDPARFLYVSRIREGDSADYQGISYIWRWLTTSVCNVTEAHVEAEINCAPKNCSVTRLRPYVTIFQRPATHTALDGTDDSVITGFSDTNRQPKVALYTISATATERFIQDPDTVTRISNHDYKLADASDGLLANISSLSKETFQARFGLAFNSYYTGTLAPSYITGTPPPFDELPAFDSSDSAYLMPDEPRKYDYSTLTGPMAVRLPGNHTFIARETSTKFVFQEKKYVCDKMWLWILVATTAVLIIAAHLGTYFKCMSVGPDILGSVSSLTRDNPYIPLPGGGCILEGAERTRLLAGLEVRVVDVRPNEEVGHIALSSLKDGVKPLMKGRLYMDS